MPTFLSRTETVSDGTTATFAIDFPFLDRSHVGVFVTGLLANYPTAYTGTVTFNSNSLVTLSPVPEANALVSIRRATPIDDLIDTLTAPSTFSADENNLIYTQLLYLIQEALDAGLDLEDEGILAILEDLRYTYDIPLAGAFLFEDNDIIGPVPVTRPVRLLPGAPGTRAKALVNPLVTHIFDILKNNTVVGEVTVATNGAVTIDVQNAVDFNPAANDAISLRTTTPGDLQNFGMTFRFIRLAGE